MVSLTPMRAASRRELQCIEFLEAIEAVPAIAYELTGLGDIAELLLQFQHADLRLDDLLVGGHRPHSFREGVEST